jgi:hypothetical protein
MKPLLLFAALALAGCHHPETAVRFRWTLKWAGGARPGTVTCAEADGQRILFELDDSRTIDRPDPTFACADGQGLLPDPLPGMVGVFAKLTNSERWTGGAGEMETLFGAVIGNVEVKDGQTVDYDAVIPLSYFSLGWSIERGGQPITCEQAGARAVRIDTTREFAPRQILEIPCTGSRGVTGVVPATHYNTVDYVLIGQEGQELARDKLVDQFGLPDSFQLKDGEVGELGAAAFKLP